MPVPGAWGKAGWARTATNDWYGFTMWGVEFMPVVFFVMLAATWIIAIILRAGNAVVRKRMH